MQRLNPDQMLNMTGLEYSLLHAQEPILYVIRKQNRHSPTQVTPLADYYIIAGNVYQGPDLCSVVNSRLLNTLHSLQSVFDEDQSVKDKKIKKKEEASSAFQRKRVDMLLGELAKKHPPLFMPPPPAHPPAKAPVEEARLEVKVEKLEEKSSTNGSMRPPPEKKQKLR